MSGFYITGNVGRKAVEVFFVKKFLKSAILLFFIILSLLFFQV